MMGSFIAGNDFNYVATHAEAIASSGKYSIVSCSSECVGVNRQMVNLSDYSVIDLILGNERNDGYSLKYYKTFPAAIRQALTAYRGNILVSGSYVGSDNVMSSDSAFVADVLHCDYLCQYREPDASVNGMGTQFDYHHSINENHYASTSSDVLAPTDQAFSALVYADGTSAAVAYNASNRRTFSMGFPFECIKDKAKRAYVMRGILAFLRPNN